MIYKSWKNGLNSVLKPFEIEIMRYLWAYSEVGHSSKQIYDAVIETLPEGKTISRSSIIVSLNALVDDGVLGFHKEKDKGGHRRIYKSKFDESGFKRYIVETLLWTLLDDFPMDTKKVISDTYSG